MTVVRVKCTEKFTLANNCAIPLPLYGGGTSV